MVRADDPGSLPPLMAHRETDEAERGQHALDELPEHYRSVVQLYYVSGLRYREIALALDKVEEGTSYGTPAFKVQGVLFARLRDDIGALVLRTTMEERPELMVADPETYFITDHYLDYPYVLVRLSRVHPDALRDLLRAAWRLAAESKRTAPKRRRPTR